MGMRLGNFLDMIAEQSPLPYGESSNYIAVRSCWKRLVEIGISKRGATEIVQIFKYDLPDSLFPAQISDWVESQIAPYMEFWAALQNESTEDDEVLDNFLESL